MRALGCAALLCATARVPSALGRGWEDAPPCTKRCGSRRWWYQQQQREQQSHDGRRLSAAERSPGTVQERTRGAECEKAPALPPRQ